MSYDRKNKMKKAEREKRMEDENRWITMREVCEYLGVTRHTIFRWMEKLEMPARKIGGNWRFKKSEIDKWIEENQEE